MTAAAPFPYDGPEHLREPLAAALSRVVDPEISMNIVDVGLVYGVTVDAARAHVRITMTSAACPVAELIMDEAEAELDKVVPAELLIRVELVWEPPWSPARMSLRAKRFMGW
ncbi:metal-sulfur cluster assembly factor [Variovorax sp. V15]|uniref:metal-sulfur cluster assembly factor n=1 Tax=Variovorax sp. V15 TaxID=3065952 RepID=UPI0034E85498